MKLLIKKEFFDKIKNNEKYTDYRDAHITFVCVETGETLRKEVCYVGMIKRDSLPESMRIREDLFNDEDMLIEFNLKS